MALSKAGLVDVIAITGETALAETPADTDEILINDGGTIKRVDFSHIKSSGLTQSDMWYMTSNITEDVGFITANWSRYTGPGGNIGSALTESSGVFSFPSTGYYKIDYIIGFRNQSSDYAFTEVYCQLHYTTDNSWPDYKVQTTYWDVEGKEWVTEDTDNMFYEIEDKK